MKFALALALGAILAAGEAQPLVAPPPPLAAPGPPAGPALSSPWLATGWDDGLAEVAEYELQQMRYGASHAGSAVLIAVREDMDASRGVKAATGADATVPVLKLHWTRSFVTGAYRYDQSSFQLAARADGRLLRWLITSHEWCGAAAKSWQPGGPLHVHSYFDGHGDVQQPLDLGADAVPADSLWWWARAWVAAGRPALGLRIVPSQIEARCVATAPQPATIAAAPAEGRDEQGRTVPALRVTVARGGLTDELLIAERPDRALLAWRQADGSTMRLIALRRSAYWERR